MIVLAVAATLAAPVHAQTPARAPAGTQAGTISLPIGKGFWTTSGQACGQTRYGYVFDGQRWGSFYFYGPNGSLGPAAELQPITATRGVAGGFTQMQFGGSDGAGHMRLKAISADRALYRVGAPFRDGIQETDEQLVRCAFGSLSQKMQMGLRRLAPGVVPAG
jgi:hypothetical protein